MCDCECLERLSPAQRAATVNGCGGKGGALRPVHWWGLEEDCSCHDVAYTLGGTEDDRLAADRELHERILLRVAVAPWWKRPYYRLQAWAYYRAVRAFGGKFFIYRPRRLTCAELTSSTPGA